MFSAVMKGMLTVFVMVVKGMLTCVWCGGERDVKLLVFAGYWGDVTVTVC